MTDEQQHITQHTAPQFTEAPYSGNVRARIRGYDWQLTIRAADSQTFTQKVDGLMNWLDTKADKAINVDAAPPTISTAVTTPAQPAQAQSGAIGGTFNITKMTVTPRADGKVELAFFEAGHQYADIKAIKTATECAALLQPIGAWTPQHFAAVAEYQVTCLIDWKPSANLNKNGKPYKNIAAVKPAQA